MVVSSHRGLNAESRPSGHPGESERDEHPWRADLSIARGRFRHNRFCNVFIKSEDFLPLVEEAIAHGAKAIWMQEGVRNESAAARARQAGLFVVMDRCWLKEHAARSNRG